MKTRYIVLSLLGIVAVSGFAKSYKRGVSENSFSYVSQLEALSPGVSWYYSWGNVPGKGYDGIDEYEEMEFLPMCWSGGYNADNIREYCKSHPNIKYLLGFNEPNFTKQANMTPQEAAEAWGPVKAMADELGLKLVAPVLNYSPNPPYQDPLKWMDEFVALVGIDAFDFTAVHNYGGLGVMKTLAGNFHERYGKPVWVTEFCYWPNEGDKNSSVSTDQQIQSMVETVEWLETTDWIYRYAWFKATGSYNASTGPNYGLVKKQDGGSTLDPWELTPQGIVYVNMSEFDKDKWTPAGKTLAASEYINSGSISLAPTKDSNCPSVLEISKFNANAYATWQFDVPKAGDYYVTLGLGGYGEPTRFNPVMQWFIVDGEEETPISLQHGISLPNSDTGYMRFGVKVTLPEGHVQLRLRDVDPYKPSGMTISTVRIDDYAGVDDVVLDSEDVDFTVYNLQGLALGRKSAVWDTLPAGIYIVGGKKVRVK